MIIILTVGFFYQYSHQTSDPYIADYGFFMRSNIYFTPCVSQYDLYKQFFPPLTVGATFNWVTESTFNTLAADEEYAATHAPAQASAAQPMFTVGTSGKTVIGFYIHTP